jgi:predicted ATPase
VQGYKILKDFALDDIRPLNVIVGPNGCGKSALWEVVTLFPDLARGPQSIFDIDSLLYLIFYPHRSTLGFDGVLNRESDCMKIELTLQTNGQAYTYTLRMASMPMSPPGFDTIEERLSTLEKDLLLYEGARAFDKKTSPDTKKYRAVINGQETEIHWPHYHPLLLLNAPNDQLAQDPFFRKLREYFQSWRGFKPVFTHLLARGYQNIDSRLTTPGERFPGEWLDTPMGNLPQVLLRLHDKAIFKDIEEIFLVAIGSDPEQRSLCVEEQDRQVKVWLKDTSWPTNRYWLGDWPDGWKAFLSWVVALRTVPSGGVIYLEEPENNLHPRLLAQLLEQVRLANQRGVQVFISTHSMELVNLIEFEELILMKDGQAYRVDPEKADKIKEAGILLGSAWVNGFLEHFSKPCASTPTSSPR